MRPKITDKPSAMSARMTERLRPFRSCLVTNSTSMGGGWEPGGCARLPPSGEPRYSALPCTEGSIRSNVSWIFTHSYGGTLGSGSTIAIALPMIA